MKEININIERVGDCFVVTENGVSRELVGDFSFEAVGSTAVINFKGHEPNPFDGWIKCSDRLPEEGEPVWVNSEHGVRTGHWCERAYEEYFVVRLDGIGVIASHATHWRPLPPLPTAPLDH